MRTIFGLAVLLLSAHLCADTAYAQLSSLTTQLPPSTGVPRVDMDSIDAVKNIEISQDKNQIIIKDPGVYFVMTAAQAGATSPGVRGYVDVWLNKNGVALPNSNTRMSIDTSTTTSVLVSQSVLTLKAGDTVSTGYAASGPSLGLVFTQPENEPAIPSIIFTAFKLDASSNEKRP